MEEWLLEQLLEWLIERVPDTDLSKLSQSDVYMVRASDPGAPLIPPELAIRYMLRWVDFPIETVRAVQRRFEHLPGDSDWWEMLGAELDLLRLNVNIITAGVDLGIEPILPIPVVLDVEPWNVAIAALQDDLRTEDDIGLPFVKDSYRLCYWCLTYGIKVQIVAGAIDAVYRNLGKFA